MRSNYLVRAISCAAVVVMAACSDASGPERRAVSLSFSSQAAASAAAGDRAPNLDITVTVGANTVVITKAQLVIRKLELKQAVTTTCPDDDSADDPSDDCEEIKLGPILVDLPLTATATTQITASIPEGTYREIEFKIHKPTSTPADAALVAANPTMANSSIRVEGTYNGEPFVFTSTITEKMELEFDEPIVITADNQNVTIQVDISSWFVVNGVVIDPRTANPGQPNAQEVTANIRASMRGFEDEDRDGEDED